MRLTPRWIMIAALFTCPMVAAPVSESLPPQLGSRIVRGMAYLARQQQPDGSFNGFEDVAPAELSTAKAIVAMLAAGQTPADGRHALVLHNAIGYLLRELTPDGYFGQSEGSGMSGQDWITLALAEACGMEADAAQHARLEPLLRSGVSAILAMQDRRDAGGAGGWNESGKGAGNLVTTALTVLALDAARGAGLDVPDDAMKRAAAFAQSRRAKGQAGFAEKDQQPSALATAAGVCILLVTRAAGSNELQDAMKFLGDRRIAQDSADFAVEGYLVTLAHVLTADPDSAKQWTAVWDVLRKQQGEDGGWLSPQAENPAAGGASTTEDSLLILTVPYRLLPLYQRSR